MSADPDSGNTRPVIRWGFLLAGTVTLSSLYAAVRLPASMLLAGMSVTVFMATQNRGVRLPKLLFTFAQGVLGCVVARSMTGAAFHEILANWQLMFFLVLSVTLTSSVLGYLLARTGVLPGSTAIWGTSAGGALIMTVMSEDYGADSRLVAFMQYFRVILVTLAATVVVGVWGETMSVREMAEAAAVTGAGAAFDWLGFALTLLLALSGPLAGRFIRFSSAPMLFPLFLGSVLNAAGTIHIVIPWWLLALSNVVVGWSIGLRFSREIILYALRVLPKIFLTLMMLIIICGGFAAGIAALTGMDPITAYLATSPGGIDAIAVLSVSIGGNMSFVMAAQTLRLIVVILIGPHLATWVARKTGFVRRTDPVKKDK